MSSCITDLSINDTHCPLTQVWIVRVFDDCLLSTRDVIGFSVGLFSTCCWMFAQLPQVFKNYRIQSAEGLSPFFLVIWFLGDFSNLGGCLLGNALSENPVCFSTQTIQAIYFLIIDIILCSQWVWYTKCRPPPVARDDEDPLIFEDSTAAVELTPVGALNDQDPVPSPLTSSVKPSTSSGDTTPKTTMLAFLPLLLLTFFTIQSITFARSYSVRAPSQRSLLEDESSPESTTTGLILAQIVAWVSTVMYLACRVPQIARNRGSTEGLAITMFATAMIANATYTSSIFIRMCTLLGLWPKLPWILGSAGVLVFDTVICCQHLYYRSRSPAITETK